MRQETSRLIWHLANLEKISNLGLSESLPGLSSDACPCPKPASSLVVILPPDFRCSTSAAFEVNHFLLVLPPGGREDSHKQVPAWLKQSRGPSRQYVEEKSRVTSFLQIFSHPHSHHEQFWRFCCVIRLNVHFSISLVY